MDTQHENLYDAVLSPMWSAVLWKRVCELRLRHGVSNRRGKPRLVGDHTLANGIRIKTTNNPSLPATAHKPDPCAEHEQHAGDTRAEGVADDDYITVVLNRRCRGPTIAKRRLRADILVNSLAFAVGHGYISILFFVA